LGVFGVTSWIYRAIIFSSVLLVVADRFLIIGIVMAAICLISWAVVPVVRFVKYLSASPRLDRVRHRAIGVTAGIAVLLVVLLAVVPFPYSFRAPGVVMASQRTEVVNETEGRVKTLVARPGSFVRQGQPLVKLENPELDLQIADTRAHLDEVNARLLQALDTDSADIEPLTRLRDSVAGELSKHTHDSENLIIRARHDGEWVAPGIGEFPGRWLPRGTDLGLLANPAAFEFDATVTENDAKSLFGKTIHGASVRLWGEAATKLPVASWRVVPGGQNTLPSPALGWAAGGEIPVSATDQRGNQSAEPFFEVIGKLDSPNGVALLDGRSGRISFKLEAEPLLPRWIRSLWQLLQKRYQI
jgi:putative peptide zinc metalloprotease protein